MLSKVKTTDKKAEVTFSSTPKRVRSVDSNEGGDENDNPIKLFKVPAVTSESLDKSAISQDQIYNSSEINVTVEESSEQVPSYRDVSMKSLALKLCIDGNAKPDINDLITVKKYIYDKIEEALEKRTYVPVPIYSKIESDGVYVGCPDSICADWLYEVVQHGIPKIKSKVVVLHQSETIPSVRQGPKMVRTVTTIPTRHDNSKILDFFAQLNKNLNTEYWRISSRRYKGANKLTIFMRMDLASFEQIKIQNSRINWIMEQVTILRERQKSKPNKGGSTSRASTAQASGNSFSDRLNTNHKPSSPSSTEVMDTKPIGSGLARKGGSVPSGKHNRK